MIKKTKYHIGVQLTSSDVNKFGAVKIQAVFKGDAVPTWRVKPFRSKAERKQFMELRRFVKNPNLLELHESDGPTKKCKDKWVEV